MIFAALFFQATHAFAGPASSLLRIPQFDGSAEGDILLFADADAPGSGMAFHWSITAESPEDSPRLRRARLEMHGHDSRLIARATLDLASGVTHWEIESAQLDLAKIFPALAPRFVPDVAHWITSGTVVLSGGGDRSAAGVFSGSAVAVLQDAAIRDDVKGWIAEGISTRVELPVSTSLQTAGAQAVSIAHFTHNASQITVENIRTRFSIENGAITLSEVRATALGGEADIDPFTIKIDSPAVETTVHVSDIESEKLAQFLPATISEVQGRFSGALTLRWNPDSGIKLGNGQLVLQKALGSLLRLAKTPGFFTSNMDKRLYVLPESWGFLRRWISIKNPAYDTLKQIEEGKQPIMVSSIAINFTPDGDSAGRTASVAIEAKPSNPKSAIKNLRINVSVTGPLVKVLEFGATERVNISF